ncbi:hypothetical protein B0A52_01588 [Exophiala mesophila]|uniref:Uncharacterized protein n=1 Tax=Exophiala mesophila TaxID=212818 RepID=A0A438NFF2_EXOME|nr:hypothetical protein B0A52_01588 [Exophiala mesophila]
MTTNGTREDSSSITKEQWDQLCQDVKGTLLEETGSEAWYLIIATVLIISPEPQTLADFWTYLTKHDPLFSTPETQSRLATRLLDVLLKQITLIGAPQTLGALIPLAKRQMAEKGQTPQEDESRPELKPENLTTQSLTELQTRGISTITSIYGTLWRGIFNTFGDYRGEMGAHELSVVYGLYLSDFRHLTALETELVVYTSIQCQGHRGPSLWHVRGLGRVLGARGSDDADPTVRRVKDVLRAVKVAVMQVVEFVGPEMVQRSKLDGGKDGLQGWPNVGDVVRELGGWGED